jgi:hypothetical protein
MDIKSAFYALLAVPLCATGAAATTRLTDVQMDRISAGAIEIAGAAIGGCSGCVSSASMTVSQNGVTTTTTSTTTESAIGLLPLAVILELDRGLSPSLP